MEPKLKHAALTFEEQITAAMLHYCYGVEQNIISVAFRTNIGRVNEACKAIKAACEKLPTRHDAGATTWSPADKHTDVILNHAHLIMGSELLDLDGSDGRSDA
jgi:hypothetical protein